MAETVKDRGDYEAPDPDVLDEVRERSRRRRALETIRALKTQLAKKETK